MSQRSPSKISAASSPCPASTWRSTSLNAALVRPPTNQRQCGGLAASNALVQGANCAATSAVSGSPLAASHPCQRPSSLRLSHAPEGPISATNQWIVRAAISPWNAPGSARTAERIRSQSSRVRTGFASARAPTADVDALCMAESSPPYFVTVSPNRLPLAIPAASAGFRPKGQVIRLAVPRTTAGMHPKITTRGKGEELCGLRLPVRRSRGCKAWQRSAARSAR